MNEQKFTATLQKSAHCEETEFYMKVKRYQGGAFLQDFENCHCCSEKHSTEKKLTIFPRLTFWRLHSPSEFSEGFVYVQID